MKTFKQSLRLFIWMTLLTGLLYPMIITACGYLFFQHRSRGSMMEKNGQEVGSELIGQSFKSNRYFWGRPSAIAYNPLPSGGSNLGPTNNLLKKAVDERRDYLIQTAAKKVGPQDVPSDLLFASASGLDPHITLASAYFQIERVASARQMDEKQKEKLRGWIDRIADQRWLGFLGTPTVNVLKLNILLDQEKNGK